jgi:hypothetical protein
LKKKRGYIVNFASELYIIFSKENDKKVARNSPLSTERDNWLSIYENIEKIIDGKQQSSIDLDIQILLRTLI